MSKVIHCHKSLKKSLTLKTPEGFSTFSSGTIFKRRFTFSTFRYGAKQPNQKAQLRQVI